jgi:hypothetical protein
MLQSPAQPRTLLQVPPPDELDDILPENLPLMRPALAKWPVTCPSGEIRPPPSGPEITPSLMDKWPQPGIVRGIGEARNVAVIGVTDHERDASFGCGRQRGGAHQQKKN